MRRIKLDFYANEKNLKNKIGFSIFVVSLLIVGMLFYIKNQLKNELQYTQIMLAQQNTTRSIDMQSNQGGEIQVQLKQATLVIDQLAFPWDKLFQTIETSVNDDISVLSVQPDTRSGLVTLDVEARNSSAMLDYVKRLSNSVYFREAHLVNHQVQQDDIQNPIRFTVVATLHPEICQQCGEGTYSGPRI